MTKPDRTVDQLREQTKDAVLTALLEGSPLVAAVALRRAGYSAWAADRLVWRIISEEGMRPGGERLTKPLSKHDREVINKHEINVYLRYRIWTKYEATMIRRYEATVADLEQRLAVAVEALRQVSSHDAPRHGYGRFAASVKRLAEQALSRIDGKEDDRG